LIYCVQATALTTTTQHQQTTNNIMVRNPTVARVQRGTANRNPSSPRTSGDTAQGTSPTGKGRRGESKDEELPIETEDDVGEEEQSKVGAEGGEEDNERGLFSDTEDEDEVETTTSTEELLRLSEQVKTLQTRIKTLTARKFADQSDDEDTDVDDDDLFLDRNVDTGYFRYGPYRYVNAKLNETQTEEKLESFLQSAKKALNGKWPWESGDWKTKSNPEAAWRSNFKQCMGVDTKGANHNWQCLMQACHIKNYSSLARYLGIRTLQDITSPDDTTFQSYITKMSKDKTFEITAIPCFKTLRVWAVNQTQKISHQPKLNGLANGTRWNIT
jgi:hypothetical protein